MDLRQQAGRYIYIIMQAIQRYHYNLLRNYLKKLQEESEIFQLPEDHLKIIADQDEELRQLYCNYQLSLQHLSQLIKQYEQVQMSLKTLMKNHKHFIKHHTQKQTIKEKM